MRSIDSSFQDRKAEWRAYANSNPGTCKPTHRPDMLGAGDGNGQDRGPGIEGQQGRAELRPPNATFRTSAFGKHADCFILRQESHRLPDRAPRSGASMHRNALIPS